MISAVDNDEVLDACLLRSPDIVNGRLRVHCIRSARSMSDAYNSGLDATSAPICILVHQDVYIPRGWLNNAIDILNQLEIDHPRWMVAGPYGVAPDGRHVGRVWDVTMGRELGEGGFEPTPVGSLDELLIIMRRVEGYRFDSDLPHFHLYGTDIVQTAVTMGRSAWALELPVVHNNRPVVSLRGGYLRAYQYARKKWRRRLPIYTSICALTINPLPLWRAQWRRRKVYVRPAQVVADPVAIAAAAGYE